MNDQESMEKMPEIQSKHNRLLVREEAYWKQHAKMHWLKDGDLNTKFFHMTTTARRNFKKTLMLVDDYGNEFRDPTGLRAVASNYF